MRVASYVSWYIAVDIYGIYGIVIIYMVSVHAGMVRIDWSGTTKLVLILLLNLVSKISI